MSKVEAYTNIIDSDANCPHILAETANSSVNLSDQLGCPEGKEDTLQGHVFEVEAEASSNFFVISLVDM